MMKIIPVLGLFACAFANSPVCSYTESNPAMQKANTILCQLAWPQLASGDRAVLQEQYWNLLAESGPEYANYGSVAGGPITQKSPQNMPNVSSGPRVLPINSAWAPSSGYFPTNDWAENIAVYPKLGTDCHNGFHRIWVDTNGMKFNVAVKFSSTGGTALHSMIQVASWDNGFKLGAAGYAKPFSLKWDHNTTGNLVRQAYYDSGFSVYLVEGTLFQGASYSAVIPDLNFVLTSSMRTVLADGTVKYRVIKSSGIYLIYANGQFVPGMPYTGNINIAAIPNNGSALNLEAVCDLHANAMAVKGQATLLPDGTYAFQYLCQNLSKQPTNQQPLVLLKTHHMNALSTLQTCNDTGFSLLGLTGPLKIYSGSTYLFQPEAPRSLDPAPNLPNGGAPITQAQAQMLCGSGGPLATQISQILSKYKSSSTVYNGGKIDYQIALTLHYGAKALQIAGLPLDMILPLYERLRTILATKLHLFTYDTLYSSIVASKTNDYGNYSDFNDHIVQYGYDLISFAILKNFEDQFVALEHRLMSQPVTLVGYQSYTHSDMADFLAADIGEMSYGNPYLPVNRNLDMYAGHSWLSGLGSKNTESQSEVVLGAWAVAYWLQVRGAPNDQCGTAKTRFALETQSLNIYNHIGDPYNSPFTPVDLVYTLNHPVVSMTWGSKLGSETYWGLQWDRILACEFMPAAANLMDTMLDFTPSFAKRGADYVLANWSNFDTGNPIQSTLIPLVSKVYGSEKAMPLINDVASRQMFDGGTNSFILQYICHYSDNLKAL